MARVGDKGLHQAVVRGVHRQRADSRSNQEENTLRT